MTNDNQPRTADSFATPADRRAFIGAQPDTRLRPAGAVPLATRLARAGRAEDLQRLINHGMVRWPASWLAANENQPAASDDPDEFGADAIWKCDQAPRN